ncbi:uncharacterized protein [Antedon mediterranea]|uniref:uncharacterized protein n=1 Tax=Antedon mediterranea TaxID=105859 RepID=UPI003AF59D12
MFTHSNRGLALVVAGFSLNLSVLGITLNYNILHLKLQEQFNATASETGIVGGVAVGLFNIASPLTTFLCQACSPRHVVIVGAIMCGSSLVVSTFLSQFSHLIFSYGVLFGVGSSFVHIPPLYLLVFYFSGKRYNRACVAILTGIGAGVAITSPLLEKCFSVYGFFYTLRMYGACTICIGLTASLAMGKPRLTKTKTCKYGPIANSKNDQVNDLRLNLINHPVSAELKAKQRSNDFKGEKTETKDKELPFCKEKICKIILLQELEIEEATLKKNCNGSISNTKYDKEITNEMKHSVPIELKAKQENNDFNDENKIKELILSEEKISKIILLKAMLQSSNFWICQPMFFLFSIGITFTFVSAANFMDEKSMSSEEIARTLSFMGIGSLITRVVFVVIASCLPVSVTFIISISNLLLCVLSILLTFDISNTCVTVLFIGLSIPRALCLVLSLPVCVELFGKRISTEAMSVAYCFFGMGSLVSQAVTDNLYDLTGSYDTALYTCSVLFFVCTLSFGVVILKSSRKQNKEYKSCYSKYLQHQ